MALELHGLFARVFAFTPPPVLLVDTAAQADGEVELVGSFLAIGDASGASEGAGETAIAEGMERATWMEEAERGADGFGEEPPLFLPGRVPFLSISSA